MPVDRTEEALARLREAEEAMTPLPWSSEWAFNARFVCPANGDRISSSSLLRMKGHNDKADAAGIVLWRNAAPALIAVVEAAAELVAIPDVEIDHVPLRQDGAIVCRECGDWWSRCPVNLARAALASLSAAVLGKESS